jgi:hypothetical protein
MEEGAFDDAPNMEDISCAKTQKQRANVEKNTFTEKLIVERE